MVFLCVCSLICGGLHIADPRCAKRTSGTSREGSVRSPSALQKKPSKHAALLLPLQGLCVLRQSRFCGSRGLLVWSLSQVSASQGIRGSLWYSCWVSFPRVILCRFTRLGPSGFIDCHEERPLGDLLSSYRAVHTRPSREEWPLQRNASQSSDTGISDNFAAIYVSTIVPVSLFITFFVAFFASLDGVVKENLVAQFASRCSPWRLVRFYGF